MARVELPITVGTLAGTNQPAVTAGNSSENNFIKENDGLLTIECINENASATTTVEFLAVKEEPGGAKVENVKITLAKKGESGAIKLVSKLSPTVFNQSTGQVYVNPSSAEVKFRVTHP